MQMAQDDSDSVQSGVRSSQIEMQPAQINRKYQSVISQQVNAKHSNNSSDGPVVETNNEDDTVSCNVTLENEVIRGDGPTANREDVQEFIRHTGKNMFNQLSIKGISKYMTECDYSTKSIKASKSEHHVRSIRKIKVVEHYLLSP